MLAACWLAACWLAVGAASAACIDLRTTHNLDLAGTLRFKIFPGSPGFEDVRKGDFPEPTYILELDDPICIEGDDNADPTKPFSTVHLVPEDATAGALRALVNSRVDVSLTEPMAANTGHHHAPLVAWVAAVAKTYDMSEDYGTPATVVRGFYQALEAGSGEEAAKFIVPERRSGPFAPAAMTAFYGHLAEPLQLISLDRGEAGQFLVRYAFRSPSGRCNGRALVSTVKRSGAYFISSIRALDGC